MSTIMILQDNPIILSNIIKWISNRKDLLRLGLCCRAFHKAVSAVAFRRLTLHSGVNLPPIPLSIAAKAEEIHYCQSNRIYRPGWSAQQDSIQILHSSLHQFSALKAINIQFQSAVNNVSEFAFPYHLNLQKEVLIVLASNRPHPTLSQMRIGNIMTHPSLSLSSPELLDFVKNIKFLQLFALSPYEINRPSENFDMLSLFWGSPFTMGEFPMFLAHTPFLTTLTLVSFQPVEGDLQLLEFPQLEALGLGNFVFSGDPDLGPEDFIVRHRTTLRRLQLQKCYLDIGNRSRRWSEVWDHLGETMTLNEVSAVNMGYGTRREGQLFEPVGDQDNFALQSLQEKARNTRLVVCPLCRHAVVLGVCSNWSCDRFLGRLSKL